MFFSNTFCSFIHEVWFINMLVWCVRTIVLNVYWYKIKFSLRWMIAIGVSNKLFNFRVKSFRRRNCLAFFQVLWKASELFGFSPPLWKAWECEGILDLLWNLSAWSPKLGTWYFQLLVEILGMVAIDVLNKLFNFCVKSVTRNSGSYVKLVRLIPPVGNYCFVFWLKS